MVISWHNFLFFCVAMLWIASGLGFLDALAGVRHSMAGPTFSSAAAQALIAPALLFVLAEFVLAVLAWQRLNSVRARRFALLGLGVLGAAVSGATIILLSLSARLSS